MECHCQDTRGMFINMRNGHRLWICDLCKGVRIFRPGVVMSPRLIDPNFEFFVRRHLALMAKLVDARDLKSGGR